MPAKQNSNRRAPDKHPQSGGGKASFLLTFIVVAAIAAVAIKVVPVYYANNKFAGAAEEIAGRAASLSEETIALQIMQKAIDFGIAEAQAPKAIIVSRVEKSSSEGICTVRLKYDREIDIYGITKIKLPTDKEIAKPFMKI
jgi:heme/copper-type cytochrome/quinol oxidase subunit 2